MTFRHHLPAMRFSWFAPILGHLGPSPCIEKSRENDLVPLPMNLKMPSLILNHLRILRFKGARRALVRGILTPALSPSDGERVPAGRVRGMSSGSGQFQAAGVLFLALGLGLSCLSGAEPAGQPGNGLTVYNKGIGGQNSEQGRARFAKDVVQLKPDFVFIYFGLNDTLNEPRFLPLDRFIENLKWMVGEARDHGIKPVLCTIHHVHEEPLLKRHRRESYGDEGPNGKIDRYNAAIRSLAKSLSAPLADFSAAVAQREAAGASVVAPDGVHLTSAGNRLLAQTFFDLVAPGLTGREVIVCLGDSVTYGAGSKSAGTAEGDTYPACLRQLRRPARDGRK